MREMSDELQNDPVFPETAEGSGRFDADRAEAIAKPNERLEESPYAQR